MTIGEYINVCETVSTCTFVCDAIYYLCINCFIILNFIPHTYLHALKVHFK